MKPFVLAGFAAFSLGAGMATAQNLTPGAAEGSLFARKNKVAPVNRDANADRRGTAKYGSSDHTGALETHHFDSNQDDGDW